MNEDLRKKHLEGITEESARQMYDRLIEEYERTYGGEIGEAAQHIVGDIALMEETKMKLQKDIAEHGVRERYNNGRQSLWRENPAIKSARALIEQQRRHLNELKLTPASMKLQTTLDENDDFTNF